MISLLIHTLIQLLKRERKEKLERIEIREKGEKKLEMKRGREKKGRKKLINDNEMQSGSLLENQMIGVMIRRKKERRKRGRRERERGEREERKIVSV